MLRSREEADALTKESGIRAPYCDPALFSNPHKYAEFIEGLALRGMIKFIKNCRDSELENYTIDMMNKYQLWNKLHKGNAYPKYKAPHLNNPFHILIKT